ncbi:MAG TPA: class I SAM-dependent methyltransferase [Gammaproteobacteria bacterium]|nr:class I SAM-dependent methyltransferase [Gammaproteobacteria bacterium]
MTAAPALVEREQCPSCGARDARVLLAIPYRAPAMDTFLKTYYHRPPDTAPLDGWSYELVRCASCSLGYQRYVPGPELLEAIYDHWISPAPPEGGRKRRGLSDYRLLAQEVQFLIEHFRKRPASLEVLDFGMGWGSWARMALAFGCKVAGSDLSLARQQHARSIGVEVLQWNELPGRNFHFINTEQVFEHLVEPAATLNHLASALAPGGLLRISVPNCRGALRAAAKKGSFEALSMDDIRAVHPLEHLNAFEAASLERFGRVAGLEPIRPSLRLLYNGTSGWLSPQAALKSLLRPIYRHLYPKSTVVYFQKAR